MKNDKLKILVYDIETAPLLSFTWGIWDQNIALNQIKSDFHILSWSAKWLGDPDSKVMYMDQRNAKNIEDDKKILQGIWKLLDEADVTVTQNGIAFDEKKLNARFLLNGMNPPSPTRNIDTLRIAKKKFALTSNKLEFMTKALCKKKKSSHKKYPGFELWKACLAGDKAAFKEMEMYNKMDVLSLEELYVDHLQKWDNTIRFDVYNDKETLQCNCGSDSVVKHGLYTNNTGRFNRYKCNKCGSTFKGSINLLSKEKKKSLLKKL